MSTDYWIISVESRKGGVGKTTAALNMANLLRTRLQAAVLFLDVDVTGTNVTDVIGSPFWSETAHKVELRGLKSRNRVDKHEELPNLLTLFDGPFMAGHDVPDFVPSNATDNNSGLTYDPACVNILGSQLYNVDGQPPVQCIAQPSILFDELHAVWFVEFVQQLCSKFISAVAATDKNQRVAIVLDNSPGYVGIAPAIQEWLTDLGPACGKFLFISSLDRQDRTSTAAALQLLHNNYLVKHQAALHFANAADPNAQKLTDDHKPFFLRLAEIATDPPCDTRRDCDIPDLTAIKLPFYIGGDLAIGKSAAENPNSYLGILLNRVPAQLKQNPASYDVEELDKLSPVFKVYRKLLDTEGFGFVRRMVSYDPYIEHQFVYDLQRRPPHRLRRLARRIHDAAGQVLVGSEEQVLRETYRLLREASALDSHHVTSLRKAIRISHLRITRSLSLLRAGGLPELAEVIPTEWLPAQIVSAFIYSLGRIMLSIDVHDVPLYLDLINFDLRLDMDPPPEVPEVSSCLSDMADRVTSIIKGNEEPNRDSIDIFWPSLQAVIALSISTPPRRPPFRDVVVELSYWIVMTQAMQWKRRQSMDPRLQRSLPAFLAQEAITGLADERLPPFVGFHYRLAYIPHLPPPLLRSLYSECCRAQARLLDLAPDSQFLLNMLAKLAEVEILQPQAILYARSIVEEVVITRRRSHETGQEALLREARNVQYMRQFTEVLSVVADEWGIPK